MILFNSLQDLKNVIKQLNKTDSSTMLYTQMPEHNGTQLQLHVVPFPSGPVIVEIKQFILIDDDIIEIVDMTNTIVHDLIQDFIK